ncbi:lysozyme inhibitor LprI family protein [Hoeflea alexandrii]|uniref:lysozyme inhibitor LprI family protein n=1 Tax=Hoeflea alexandrii TaxID=288436 RepID=UPI0022AF9A3D|nr:lysozyme inhibitor LprI family protein [Hoeflea alexandrii]MCZ4287845.1 DUF1311 domain-containing protein [Hoeflea alexandrii]
MSPARALIAASALLIGMGEIAHADTPALKSEIDVCKADPVNKIGGAAIGECLENRSVELDAEIADLLGQSIGKLCSDPDRRIIQNGQKAWAEQRSQQCGLITRSPGNTASYVNGASCMVLQGHQRIEQLSFFNRYASPFCYGFALEDRSSVAGEVPYNQSFAIRDTQLQWSLSGGPDEATLDVTSLRTGKLIATMHLNCFFCSGDEDNCSADGVYVLRQRDVPEAPAIFAVCHKGAHSQTLQLVDPTQFGSEIRLEVTGNYYLDWSIKDGRLQVLPDGEMPRAQLWPGD